MKRDHQETERFLRMRYPHIKNARLFLERLDAIIALMEPFNGGNIETLIRWSQGEAQWTDGKFRDLMRDSE